MGFIRINTAEEANQFIRNNQARANQLNTDRQSLETNQQTGSASSGSESTPLTSLPKVGESITSIDQKVTLETSGLEMWNIGLNRFREARKRPIDPITNRTLLDLRRVGAIPIRSQKKIFDNSKIFDKLRQAETFGKRTERTGRITIKELKKLVSTTTTYVEKKLKAIKLIEEMISQKPDEDLILETQTKLLNDSETGRDLFIKLTNVNTFLKTTKTFLKKLDDDLFVNMSSFLNWKNGMWAIGIHFNNILNAKRISWFIDGFEALRKPMEENKRSPEQLQKMNEGMTRINDVIDRMSIKAETSFNLVTEIIIETELLIDPRFSLEFTNVIDRTPELERQIGNVATNSLKVGQQLPEFAKRANDIGLRDAPDVIFDNLGELGKVLINERHTSRFTQIRNVFYVMTGILDGTTVRIPMKSLIEAITEDLESIAEQSPSVSASKIGGERSFDSNRWKEETANEQDKFATEIGTIGDYENRFEGLSGEGPGNVPVADEEIIELDFEPSGEPIQEVAAVTKRTTKPVIHPPFVEPYRKTSAYCVKGKVKVPIMNPKKIEMKNGRPATRGTCPYCKTKIFVIGQ